jgi:hypothetical protein
VNATAESPDNLTLDALAYIAAMERDDHVAANAMSESYANAGELGELVKAVFVVTVQVLRYAAWVNDVPPAKFLDVAMSEIRAHGA